MALEIDLLQYEKGKRHWLDPLEKYKHIIDQEREKFLKEHENFLKERTKDKFDPTESRDPSGKWTAGGGSGKKQTEQKQTTSFVSPNEDPNNLSFTEAVSGLKTKRQKLLSAISHSIDSDLGINDIRINPVVGAWSDGAENSVMTNSESADPDIEEAAAAMKGYLANQKAVLLFHPDEGGHQFLAQFRISSNDLADIHQKLLDSGVIFHTIEPRGNDTIVHFYGESEDDLHLFSDAAKQFDQKVQIHRGHGKFIPPEVKEDGTDAEQRAASREAYLQTIRRVADTGKLRSGFESKWQNHIDNWQRETGEQIGGEYKPARSERVEDALNDAFNSSKHPRGQPGNAGQFGPGGGGKSATPKQKPWIEELKEKQKNRPGVVSRAAHAATHGAVHLLGEFSKEDYEILKHHLQPNSKTRHQYASRILKIATLLPKLLQAHLKEEYHKFKNAGGALKAMATGKRPTSAQWKGLRQAATTVLLTGAVFMLTGDPTGGHVAQAATHAATQVGTHGATQVAGHVATQVAGHAAEQAAEHTAGAAAAHLAAEFGHEMVSHTMIEHAAKFGLGFARLAARMAVSTAIGAGVTHLKHKQEEDTSDAMPDDTNTPIDANEMKLLQDYINTLANVVVKHPIQDQALYDSLPDEKDSKTKDEYDPSEERDKSGKWTSGGGSSKPKKQEEEEPDDYEEPAYSDPSEKIAPEYHEPQPTPAKPSDNFTPPKKTVKAYKLFETKPDQPGKLFPLFIDSSTSVPIGEWMPGKPVPTKSFAPRPGWHAGELPLAPHLRDSATHTKIAPSRVWAEVELPDDEDWQSKADKNGRMSKGTKKSPSHWIAGEIKDQVPHGGHYKFNTKPGQGGTWLIGGAIRVKKVLTDDEVHDILTKAGKHEDAKHETNRSEPFPFKHSKTKDSRWRFLHVHTLDRIFRIKLKDAEYNPADHPHAPEGAPAGKGGQFVSKGSKPSGSNTAATPAKKQSAEKAANTKPDTTAATQAANTSQAASGAGRTPLKGSKGHPGLISSAGPKGKDAEFNQPSVALTKTSAKQFKGMIQTYRENPSAYPLTEDQLAGDDDTVAKNVIDHIKSNLKFIFNQTPKAERERTRKWYTGARKMVDDHVETYKEYGLKDTTVAGVLACLSPTNLWDQNVRQADQMIDIYLKHRHDGWDDKMTAAVDKIKNPSIKRVMELIKDKGYDELETDEEKGLWIRAYDQGHSVDNPEYKELGFQPFHKITPEGNREGWYTKPVNVSEYQAFNWQSAPMMAKAIKILESNGDPQVIDRALRPNDPKDPPAHKVRSFYNNILDPDSDNDDVTMDTHAVDAAWFMDEPIGAAHNFGNTPQKDGRPLRWVKGTPGSVDTGVSGNYGFNADAYREAAHELGLKPRELQSVVWETKRKWMENMTEENHQRLRDTWEDFRLGMLTQEEAQKKAKQIVDEDLASTPKQRKERSKANALRNKRHKQEFPEMEYAPMADSLADTPLIGLMKKAKVPITRQNYIDVCWGDNPPEPWNAEAEDQIPKELQDWSWLPHPGNPETEYASSDIPSDPEDEDDADEDAIDDEEDADYGEDEDEDR